MNRGDLALLFSAETIARFWSKVDKSGPVPVHRPEIGPCWVWTGSTAGRYGAFHAGPRRGPGKNIKAHRAAWFLEHGIQPSLCVLHHCDNPSCVRPSHLFEGTQQANIADMKNKGRARGKDQRGEKHALTKLTDALVIRARERAAAGEWVGRIARDMGLSKPSVFRAVRGETWSHLPGSVPCLSPEAFAVRSRASGGSK